MNFFQKDEVMSNCTECCQFTVRSAPGLPNWMMILLGFAICGAVACKSYAASTSLPIEPGERIILKLGEF